MYGSHFKVSTIRVWSVGFAKRSNLDVKVRGGGIRRFQFRRSELYMGDAEFAWKRKTTSLHISKEKPFLDAQFWAFVYNHLKLMLFSRATARCSFQ